MRIRAAVHGGIVFAGLLWAAGSAAAQATPSPSPVTPLYTTARETHSLTEQQAQRHDHVHLRVTVTYYDPQIDPGYAALFVQDATGSIYIASPTNAIFGTVSAGAMIDVRGIIGFGVAAPIIFADKITVLRQGDLPQQAPRVSLTRLLRGADDGQWVEAEGVVHSVSASSHNVTLQVSTQDGTVSAVTVGSDPAPYMGLVDAKVRIRANAAPWFNGVHHMTGVRLMFPNLSTIEVLEPPPHDVFQQPPLAISSLAQYDPLAIWPHRVHLRGRVTLQWPGSSLCIRDATQALCAQTPQKTPVALSGMVDLVGFAATGESSPILTDAVYEEAGPGTPLVPQPLTAEQVLAAPHEAEVITVDGELIGRDLAAADTTLIVSSGSQVFTAVLPTELTGAAVKEWKNGSRVRLTGICALQTRSQRSVRAGGGQVPKYFRILLRSAEDVVVLRRPSWWTPAHAVAVLGLLLTATMVVLGRVFALSKRVEQQRNLIRQSEERFRHLAQHDSLTGLPTRMLLHDRLNAALERAKRYGPGLAIMMLDLDKFKQINDSLGHDAGDETLRVSAERMTRTVRQSDTVARVGGDEFIVLLSDLRDPKEAERVAAKMVEALRQPIQIGEREVPISASVGVCTSSGRDFDAVALMKNADIALYRAKSRGRDCFEVFTLGMVESAHHKPSSAEAPERKDLELHYTKH